MKRDAYPNPECQVLTFQIQLTMTPEPRITMAGISSVPLMSYNPMRAKIGLIIWNPLRYDPCVAFTPLRVVDGQQHPWVIGIPNVQSRILATSAGQRREPPSTMLPETTNPEKREDQGGAREILAWEVRTLQQTSIPETCSLTQFFNTVKKPFPTPKPYSREDDQKIIDHVKKGENWQQIASKLGHTKQSVKQHWNRRLRFDKRAKGIEYAFTHS